MADLPKLPTCSLVAMIALMVSGFIGLSFSALNLSAFDERRKPRRRPSITL